MSLVRELSFADAMVLMRKHDAQSREDGFHALLTHASEHVQDLMTEFTRETDHGLRCWLMELIGAAKAHEAFDLMCGWALSSDDGIRPWAIRGLAKLDTKPARTFIFENRLVVA